MFAVGVKCEGECGPANEKWILVREGTASFGGTLEGVAVASCGTDCVPVVTLKGGCSVQNYGIVLTAYGKDGEKCWGETHQEDSSVFDYRGGCYASLFNSGVGVPLSNPNGGSGRYVMDGGSITTTNNITFFKDYDTLGEFEFVQNGGTMELDHSAIFMARAYNSAKFTYTLNGGEMLLKADGTFRGSRRQTSVVNLNGGVVKFAYEYDRGAPVRLAMDSYVTIVVGGGVATLDVTGTPNTILLDNDITGHGTLALMGNAIDEDGEEGVEGVGKFLVTGGMNMHILRLVSGEVDFAEGARASAAGLTMIDFPESGARAVLDYDGMMPYAALRYSGAIRRKGVYSAESVPDPNAEGVKAQIRGEGALLIKGGPGLVQSFR